MLTTMNKEFFDTSEHDCLQLLYEFNEKYKLFDFIKPSMEKASVDLIAAHNSRRFAVELKHRFMKLGKYETLFIEDYKLAQLYLQWVLYKREPLYINILHDAVVIFNLNKLKHKPKLVVKDIKSKGYETVQKQERRFELSLEDAVIYTRDGN